MAEQYLPNLLLVAGVGRNSGKTTFICGIIEKFHKTREITAIKISPHLHSEKVPSPVFLRGNNYIIYEETSKDTGKDSSRFLKTGATKVYYIRASDESLENAWKALSTHLEPNIPLVCEGGWLRKFVKPGLFIHCNYQNTLEIKESAKELIKLSDFQAIGNFSELISGIAIENDSFVYHPI